MTSPAPRARTKKQELQFTIHESRFSPHYSPITTHESRHF
jgi:hypothetical protein